MGEREQRLKYFLFFFLLYFIITLLMCMATLFFRVCVCVPYTKSPITRHHHHCQQLHSTRIYCRSLTLALAEQQQLVEEVISKPSGEEDNQKSEPKEPTIEKKIYSQNLVSCPAVPSY